MSRVIIAGGYSLDEYLLYKPQIAVPSSMLSGSFIGRQTQFDLKYHRGVFDGDNPVFSIGDDLAIYNDDDERLFSGYVSSATTNRGVTTIICDTNANRVLSGVVNFEATNTQPTTALASWLDSVGISHRGLESIAARNTSILCNALCPAAQNTKGYDFVSNLVDMISADVSIVDDTLVFYERDDAYNGYEIDKVMNYPEQTDDGTQRQYKGVSIRYVFDGQVPYTEGEQEDKTWSPDYSNGSAFQLIGTQSAVQAASLRLTRYKKPHTVYSIKVRAKQYPIVLGDWYKVTHGPMDGRYRLIGYDTDGEVYMLQMEAE